MNLGMRHVFCAGNLVSAAALTWVVIAALPARWWVVDTAALIAIAAYVVAGAAWLCPSPACIRLARAGAAICLMLGMLLLASVLLSISWLSGIYGPIGAGGAALFTIVALLTIPYAIAWPLAQCIYAGRALHARKSEPCAAR